MKMRKVYILLAAWCFFMIAPALLVESGLFGPFDMKTNVSGGVILFWTLGYLAQLAAFMWAMNVMGEQRVLWWFVASLLPWVVDWTVPVSPLYFLAWLPVTIGLAVWMAQVARQAEAFQEKGIKATGVVLEVLKPWMNVVINNVYIKRKVRLRIERHDGVPAYEGILNGLFMLGEIPSVGDRIPLLVDPAKPQRFESDQGASPEPSVPARSAAASVKSGENVVDELEKLTDLRDRGALTDAEFNAAKKKLLRS